MPRLGSLGAWARSAAWLSPLAFVAACESSQPQPELAVAASGQALSVADCPAGYNVIVGTSFADTLNGTAGNDCIVGNGGLDTIHGLGGNDFLIGGSGNDRLYGDDGNDAIYGETDDDTLEGGDGNDTIEGAGGLDTINGGTGADTLIGGNSVDTINGGDGNDTIRGDAGNDNLNGGADADTIYGGDSSDTIHGDGGNDRIFGEAGTDFLYGDAGNDVIDGGANADTIRGGDGDDAIDGDLANDTLYGDAGEDALVGGAGSNTADGGTGTDACSGANCELPQPVLTGCTQNAQCSSGQSCIVDLGLCLGCLADQDGDGVCNSADGCPSDPAKSAPGACGCGVSDADGDGDGTPSCNDGCPSDPAKIAPGICGCGVSDADGDGDGIASCNDGCPSDPAKTAPGVCGCGVSDADSDGDGNADCSDACPSDPAKSAPGICGCGVSDVDTDGDGTASCNDGCPNDAAKVAPGVCGCGVSDADGDTDGTPNCNDGCPSDAAKVAPGTCGCGVADTDSDSDGTPNCNDGCPNDAAKVAAGVCGCGVADTDSDSDGTPNCSDGCPSDAAKVAPGACGCGMADIDSDGDGTANCNDGCPSDAAKVAPGTCGCSVADTDSDSDGVADCVDQCPGFSDAANADGDSKPDVCDTCPTDASNSCDDVTTFEIIPELSAVRSRATAVSANGQMIVGWRRDGSVDSAFRFGEADGLVALAPGYAGSPSTMAEGVSADGQVIIGSSRSVSSEWVYRAVRWNAAGAITANTTSGSHLSTWIAPNASFSLGFYLATYETVERFTPSMALNGTVGPFVGYWVNRPAAASDSGSVVLVNRMNETNGITDSLLYNGQLASPVLVPHRAGTNEQELADLTTDGLLAVGFTSGTGGDRAVTWSQAGGYTTIPGLTSCSRSDAVAVANPSGLTRVVGHCGTAAYLWDGTSRVRMLRTVLTQLGMSQPAFSQLYVADVSRDARTLVGYGVGTSDGIEHAWVLHLGDDFTALPCSETDSDGDGTPSCYDDCPSDGSKTQAGVCGCGVSDADSDGDGTPNCNDLCPSNAGKIAPGICGCATADTDSDGDGTPNCNDACPSDAAKTAPGVCGCGTADTDSDGDGTANCLDGCPSDANKLAAGACGCGVSDADGDGDGTANCNDDCPSDPAKIAAGACGCGVSDADGDGDGVANCIDGCPADAGKSAPGVCGCGVSDADSDNDGTPNCNDGCPSDAAKVAPGACGCGTSDVDSDGDGTPSCLDGCPSDAGKTAPGICGCGTSDVDEDGDGTANCIDECPDDPNKTLYGACGCGVSDADSDSDGVADCMDICAGFSDAADADGDGIPDGCDPELTCTETSSGPAVHQGHAYVISAFDAATLEGKRCITGDLILVSTSPDALALLESLEAIAGSLTIVSTQLDTLDGLGNLQRVGAYVSIIDNPELTNLAGLAQLIAVGPQWEGTLEIQANPLLPGCWVWELERQLGRSCGNGAGNTCTGNQGSGSCGELPPGFECVAGAVGPGVIDGDVALGVGLGNQPDVGELGGVSCITGNVSVDPQSAVAGYTSQLAELRAIGGSLTIEATSLLHLGPFESLESIGVSLTISNNEELRSAALPALISLGEASLDGHVLAVQNNPCLLQSDVTALELQTGETCGWNDGSPLECTGNALESCPPPQTLCIPGAIGEGIYDGDVWISGEGTAQLSALAGITCITGSVYIDYSTLVDLQGLESLEQIGGQLYIQQNEELQSLAGLEQLHTIGGELYMYGNSQLTSLAGLSGLTSLGEALAEEPFSTLSIISHDNLPGCWAWMLEAQTGELCGYIEPWSGQVVHCSGNRGVGSCGSLPEGFECVPGAVGPGVFDDDLTVSPWSYPSVDLSDFGGLSCVTGSLSISSMTFTDLGMLSSLQAVGGQLRIENNMELTSVDGLENLQSVGQDLYISYNPQLNDLAGLSNVTSVGDQFTEPAWTELYIFDNESLSGCWTWLLEGQTGASCGYQGWEGLTRCNGNHGTSSCGELPPGFECVPGAVGPGVYHGNLSLSPYDYPPTNLADFGGLACVTGSVSINNTTYTDLGVLSNLQGVGDSLSIENNMQLTSLAGLESLSSVGGTLYVSYNPQLNDLAGLSGLTSVGDQLTEPIWATLYIVDNESLPGCWAWMIEGQTGELCGYNGWEGLMRCSDNHGTGSCGELPAGFECVPGAVGPGVYNGDLSLNPYSYPQVDFADLGGLSCITGSLIITSTTRTDLSELSGLQGVGGSLQIDNNLQLTSLTGLEDLSSVGADVSISYNPQLNDLSELPSLTSVGEQLTEEPIWTKLYVFDNESMSGCWTWLLEAQTGVACGYSGWEGQLTRCSGNHGTDSCGELPQGFECVPGATGPGVFDGDLSVTQWTYPPIDFADYGGLACVTGTLSLSGTTYTDLTMLSGLQAIGGALSLQSNQQLSSVAGLEGVATIGGGIEISYNNALTSLAGLSGLTTLGDGDPQTDDVSLYVFDNAALAACWPELIESQTGEQCGFLDWQSAFIECSGNWGSGSCP